jgi:tetratricopeptide (TPR) repeat protein
MSKKLNLRFFCYSLACFAVLGVGVYFLHMWQVQRQSGILLAKAEEAETQGNVGKAIDLYGKYLVLAPKETDAQSRYGSLLFDAHAYAPAINAFEAVLRRDPGRSDIRRKAVKADLAIGRTPDARDHLENYLLKEFPDDAELLDLEGQCLARAGEYTAAGRSLEKAIERGPTRIAAYLHLIAILSRPREDLDKDRDEWLKPLPLELRTTLKQDTNWPAKAADYWSNRLVDSNPKDPQAYLFRGSRRYSKRLFDGTIQDVEAVLKLIPDDPAALHLAAVSCLEAKQLDKSGEYAKRGIKASPKDWRMYEIMAQIDLARQKSDEALLWLQKGVDADGPSGLLWTLGSLQIAKGKLKEAGLTARGLRERTFKAEPQSSVTQVGPDLYADLLEAQIEQARGHWTVAAKRLTQIGTGLKPFPDLAKQAFYTLGKSYEQLADVDLALKAYRQAVDTDPMWVLAREAVAATLRSLGRIDEALEEQSTLTRLKDAPVGAWVNLIRWSTLRTLRLSVDKRDWQAVNDLVNQLAKSAPQSNAVPLLRAEILMAQDRASEAEKLIEAEKNRDPKEIAFWITLVDLAMRDNRWDRARQILEEAQKELGDRVALRLTRARYLIRRGEKGAAEQIRKLAEKSPDISAQDQVQLWRNLVPAALAADDFPEAEQLCQLLLAQSHDDLLVRLELFDLAAQANDVKLMDTALDEIQKIPGSEPIWHYAKALRLVISDRPPRGVPATKPAEKTEKPSPVDTQRQTVLKQALDHLADALRLRPNWSRALLLQGLVYEESHQEDAALAKYLEAVKQGENNPEIARRALRLLYGKGEYAAANNLLRQLEGQQVPFTTELFRDQSRVLGGLQDYAGALKSAQRAADSSKDFHDYLWLGQLLSILGQREEAEKALQQASLLNEKAPETLVAQVEFFVRTGQRERAEKALASGREKIPAAEAPLAIAECLEILGKTDEAGQQYALALKQKPDDAGVVRSEAIYHVRQGDLRKAAEQLVRIVNGQVRGTPQQMAEARSDLARVRADQGGYPNLLEAIRLADENLAVAPSSTDNLRLKARLLANYPQITKRREAMAIFEKLVEDPKTAAAEDRFRLAQLYLASGDWAKARPQLLALVAMPGNQPQYLATYAHALLDHKEFSEAEPWIDRLEEIAPEKIGTVRLRAEVQFRRGNVGEAIATLTKFIEKSQDASADRFSRTLAAAAELEALAALPSIDTTGTTGAMEKAEELYRTYVKAVPKQRLVLAGFLGRQKRFDEALKLVEEACPTADAPLIAATCELLVRQPGISSAQFERLAEVLAAALKKHGRAGPLLLAMAQLRETQEKYTESETLYREILQADANSVPAMNNLALLLALSGRKLDEAKDLIEKAITTAGPQPSLLDTRASVYLASGQAEKAVADMQEVLDEQPAPNRYFHLALAQQKLGHKADATDFLMKARAMQIRPESLHPLERPAYAELVHALL